MKYKAVFFSCKPAKVYSKDHRKFLNLFFNWELKAQQINAVSLKSRLKTLQCLRGLSG